MRSLRPVLRRFYEDEDFRLNVSYAVVLPFYVASIAGVFWWGLAYG